MIDTSSIESLVNTLPKKNQMFENLLSLKMYSEKNIKKETISLGLNGYIGCLPFANSLKSKIAIRILPDSKINQSPIVVTWKYVVEGLTIANDLEHFVAGRIAQMDLCTYNIPSREEQQLLISFSLNFGNSSSCQNILSSLDKVKLMKDSERRGCFWEEIELDNPFYKILGMTRKNLSLRIISEWIVKFVIDFPWIDIGLRIYISLYEWLNKKIEIEKYVFELIQRDDVYDSTYNGMSYGSAPGEWKYESLVKGINWINNKDRLSSLPISFDLWEAAIEYASNPLKYDGEKHLSYAKRIANDDPIQAYTQTCNAAAYYARSKKKPPIEAINFAYELARENKWEHLETILKWTIEGMDK